MEKSAAPERSRIFISYRREDTRQAVGRLTEDLREQFGRGRVFADMSSILPGADFGEALEEGLRTSAAVLVVIGSRWMSASDKQGRRRLDLAGDWVSQEIAESLRRPGVRVFPVVVDDAQMPSEEDLPEVLRPLVRRQAHVLTDRHWPQDVAQLVGVLRTVPGLAAIPVPGPRGEPAATSAASHATPVGWVAAGLKWPRGAWVALIATVVVLAVLVLALALRERPARDPVPAPDAVVVAPENRPEPVQSTPSSPPQAMSGNEILRRLLDSGTTKDVLRLIQVPDLAMQRVVRVSIVGGYPTPGALPRGSYSVVKVPDRSSTSNDAMRKYTDSLVQWVRVIAPRAHFIFEEPAFSGGDGNELMQSLETHLAQSPEVLLFAYGPVKEDWRKAMSSAAESGVLIVAAAGNDASRPFPFEGTDIMKQILVAAATDLTGRPAQFSTRVKGGCWVPGKDLPTVEVGTNLLTQGSGTSYSAAICAGVAARLIATAKARQFDPRQVVATINETSAAVNGSEARVVQVEAALKRMR